MPAALGKVIAPIVRGVSNGFAAGRTCWRQLCLVALLALATGCNPNSPFRNYAGAVGPDLYSKQTVRNTNLLTAYTANLCVQAGLPMSGNECHLSTTADWKQFVDMGLYDIDQRCDTFLDNLYYKDKTTDSILAQISDTAAFTGAVLDATKSTRAAITIVAAAFNLAENTFSNARQSLLDALDPTTVKSIVFSRQQVVKKEIYAATISSKPQALHALRTYLRVCMPFAIEMEANAVLTTVQRTGEPGASPIVFADVKPLEPGQQFGSGNRNGGGIKTPKDFDKIFSNPSKYEKDDLVLLQNAMCLQGQGVGIVGDKTKSSINIYENTAFPSEFFGDIRQPTKNGLIDDYEWSFITSFGDCSSGSYRNIFERSKYDIVSDGAANNSRIGLIRLLNARLNAGLPEELTLEDVRLREAIEKARQAYGTSDYQGFAKSQVTPDLLNALTKAPPPQAPN